MYNKHPILVWAYWLVWIQEQNPHKLRPDPEPYLKYGGVSLSREKKSGIK